MSSWVFGCLPFPWTSARIGTASNRLQRLMSPGKFALAAIRVHVVRERERRVSVWKWD